MEHNCTKEDRIKALENDLKETKSELRDLPTMKLMIDKFTKSIDKLNDTNQKFEITLTRVDLNLANLNQDAQETKEALKDNENKNKIDTRDIVKNFIFYVLSPSCLIGFIIYTIATKIGG